MPEEEHGSKTLKDLLYVPGNEAWKINHRLALRKGGPVLTLLQGWHEYARQYLRLYESHIGEDYVLGPVWEIIGRSLRELLNGELGGLDAGTLDTFLTNTLHAHHGREE